MIETLGYPNRQEGRSVVVAAQLLEELSRPGFDASKLTPAQLAEKGSLLERYFPTQSTSMTPEQRRLALVARMALRNAGWKGSPPETARPSVASERRRSQDVSRPARASGARSPLELFGFSPTGERVGTPPVRDVGYDVKMAAFRRRHGLPTAPATQPPPRIEPQPRRGVRPEPIPTGRARDSAPPIPRLAELPPNLNALFAQMDAELGNLENRRRRLERSAALFGKPVNTATLEQEVEDKLVPFIDDAYEYIDRITRPSVKTQAEARLQAIEDRIRKLVGADSTNSRPETSAGGALSARTNRVADNDVDLEGRKTPSKEQISSKGGAMARINELFKSIVANYMAVSNATTRNEVTIAVKEIRELAEEFLSNVEQQLIEDIIAMRDAVNTQSGSDSSKYLAWSDQNPAAKARIEAQKYCNDAILRRFLSSYETLGGSPVIRTVSVEGREIEINLKQIITKIEDYFSGPYPYDIRDPSKTYNYAAMGNPDQNAVAMGVPKIEDLLKRDFPQIANLPFLLDAIINFIIISEMRHAFYIPAYAGYMGSPIPGFDGSPSEDMSPIAACLYKAQATSVFPKHRAIAAVTRLAPPTDRRWDDYINKHRLGRKVDYTAPPPSPLDLYNKDSFGQPETLFSLTKAGKEGNIRHFFEVRNTRIALTMPTGVPGIVTLRPDMLLKPGFYHWLKRRWPGGTLGNITYHQFYTLEGAFDKLEEFVDDKFAPPKDLGDAREKITKLVEKVRDVKTFFDPSVGLEDPDQILLSTVQLLMIIYLGKLYRGYKPLIKRGNKTFGASKLYDSSKRESTLQSFSKELAEKLLGPGTLPPIITKGGRFPMTELVNDLGESRMNLPSKYRRFFDDDYEMERVIRAKKDRVITTSSSLRDRLDRHDSWTATTSQTEEKKDGH